MWHVTFDVAELSRSEEFCWCICHHGRSHAVSSRGAGVRLAGVHTHTGSLSHYYSPLSSISWWLAIFWPPTVSSRTWFHPTMVTIDTDGTWGWYTNLQLCQTSVTTQIHVYISSSICFDIWTYVSLWSLLTLTWLSHIHTNRESIYIYRHTTVWYEGDRGYTGWLPARASKGTCTCMYVHVYTHFTQTNELVP